MYFFFLAVSFFMFLKYFFNPYCKKYVYNVYLYFTTPQTFTELQKNCSRKENTPPITPIIQ